MLPSRIACRNHVYIVKDMISRKILAAGIACAVLLGSAWLWTSRGEHDAVVERMPATPSAPALTAQSTDTVSSHSPEQVIEQNAQGEQDSADATYASVIDSADTLMECTLDGSCVAEDQSDPRAGHLQAVGRLSRTLDALVEAAHTDENLPTVELGSFARRALAFPDGHVQARAISLMGALAPDPQNVDTIVTHLDGHHDAALFELAMAELGRYAGGADAASSRIDDLLIDTLTNGAHFVAQTVAANVGKLLDADNVDRFESLSRELPQQSRTAKILRSTLAEYRLVTSDG